MTRSYSVKGLLGFFCSLFISLGKGLAMIVHLRVKYLVGYNTASASY